MRQQNTKKTQRTNNRYKQKKNREKQSKKTKGCFVLCQVWLKLLSDKGIL